MATVMSKADRDLSTANSQMPHLRLSPSEFIDARPISAIQYQILMLCALILVLDGLDTQLIGYLGPAIATEWSVPVEQLGPIFSASLVGLMIGMLVIGMIADIIGRRRAILVSVFLFASCTLLTAIADSIGSLVTYRFLAGIGLGGAMPNALALTGEYSPRRLRATISIIIVSCFSLGSILGGLVAALLLEDFGWRAIFVFGGVLPLVLLPLLVWKLPESLHFQVLRQRDHSKVIALLKAIDASFDLPHGTRLIADNSVRNVPTKQLFTDGRTEGTLTLWLVFIMNLMVFYFLQNWLPTILVDSGLPIRSAVVITTLIPFGGIAAGLIAGPLMDKYDAYKVLGGLYVSALIFVPAMGMVSSHWIALMTFCAGFCVSGAQKSLITLAVIFYPTSVRSTGIGWVQGIGRLGSILGPLTGGMLLGFGWDIDKLFLLAALPLLLAAVMIFAMDIRYAGHTKDVSRSQPAPAADTESQCAAQPTHEAAPMATKAEDG